MQWSQVGLCAHAQYFTRSLMSAITLRQTEFSSCSVSHNVSFSQFLLPPPLWSICFFLSGGGSWLGCTLAHLCKQLAAKSGSPRILQALNFHSAMQLLTCVEVTAVISRHFFFYRGVLLLKFWPYFSLLALATKTQGYKPPKIYLTIHMKVFQMSLPPWEVNLNTA